MVIKIKRIYEPYAKSDGYRILVDRLWPRGIRKEDAHIDQWIKEVAPSTGLRKWFNHQPENWNLFVTKYQDEVNDSIAFEELISLAQQYKTITLLYSAKDEQYNQAVALRQFLITNDK